MMSLSGPELTASDYLLTIADLEAQRGTPFADLFRLMVAEARRAAVDDDLAFDLPLLQHEATPVDIISRAYEAAVKRRDREAQHKILLEGLALLARWPTFLLDLTSPTWDGLAAAERAEPLAQQQG